MDFYDFLDYEMVREYLYIRLSSMEKDRGLYRLPHRQIADLMITAHIFMQDGENEMTSMAVDREFLKCCRITQEKLFEDAVENAQRIFPAVICPMHKVLDVIARDLKRTDTPIMMISNPSMFYGAAAFFYPGVMERVASILEGDFYMLPSSVHEVLAIPDEGNWNWRDLESIVRSINQTEVDEKEWLSDHVYHYDAKRKQFRRGGTMDTSSSASAPNVL